MPVNGSCQCGAVKFQIEGSIPDVVICHCTQCRKFSGHAWASVLVSTYQLSIAPSESLKWFRSSDFAQRGFCSSCGSSLFYKTNSGESTAVSAGTLETPTNLRVDRHIFTKDKSDYYRIASEEVQFERY